MGVIHKNPTEESFIIWLSNHPQSFHSLDMQRFYTFVKNAISYHSKRWFDRNYFESQIKLHVPTFSEENIEYFYERLLICKNFHESYLTPLIDNNGDVWSERKVVKHKIVDTTIEDIKKYFSKNGCNR